jgi:hypothetical protein
MCASSSRSRQISWAGAKECHRKSAQIGYPRGTEGITNDASRVRRDYGRLTNTYSKVFYYDALPERKSDEDDQTYHTRIAPQRHLFDRLSNLDRFHVYEGDVRRSSSRRGPEQKKIGVMIAVDMLTHSFRRNMHEATLLTGHPRAGQFLQGVAIGGDGLLEPRHPALPLAERFERIKTAVEPPGPRLRTGI